MLNIEKAKNYIQSLEDDGILFYDAEGCISISGSTAANPSESGIEKCVIVPKNEEFVIKLNIRNDDDSIYRESNNYEKITTNYNDATRFFAETSHILYTNNETPFIVQEKCVCPTGGVSDFAYSHRECFIYDYLDALLNGEKRHNFDDENRDDNKEYTSENLSEEDISDEELFHWLEALYYKWPDEYATNILPIRTREELMNFSSACDELSINDLHNNNFGWSMQTDHLVVVDFAGY